jgi:G3E family GTPase
MKIHLVAGFLGSGKTTAITNASQLLIGENITASIITNDQGKFQVDSHFVKGLEIANAEVSGGCFCCNYNQLDEQIEMLRNEVKPDLIFAESVGSCTDLVATVLKPLLNFKTAEIENLTFTTFVDARLLLTFLKGNELPFESETNYIWQKQIEESEILVINKIDLVSEADLAFLKRKVAGYYTSKQVLYQNSLDNKSIEQWLEALEQYSVEEHQTIEVDYEKYGVGEANLAWLDEEIEFVSEKQEALQEANIFIDSLIDEFFERKLPVGHLKFLLKYNDKSKKISYTTVFTENSNIDSNEKADRVKLIVNARIQISPIELREIIVNAISKQRGNKTLELIENSISYFQPGFPNPTYRIA